MDNNLTTEQQDAEPQVAEAVDAALTEAEQTVRVVVDHYYHLPEGFRRVARLAAYGGAAIFVARLLSYKTADPVVSYAQEVIRYVLGAGS